MYDIEIIRKFIKDNNIKKGDAIVTYFTGLKQAKHFIIVIDEDNFIENTRGKNVNRLNASDMLHVLGKFHRIDRFEGNDYQRELVIERAYEIESRGKQYSLPFNNCEDFKNEVWTGQPYSRQVDIGCWIALIFGAILLFFGIKKRNDKLIISGGILLASVLLVQLVRSSDESPRVSLLPR